MIASVPLAVRAEVPWWGMLVPIVIGVLLIRFRDAQAREAQRQWSRLVPERWAAAMAKTIRPTMVAFGALAIAVGLFGLLLAIAGPIGE